MSIDQATIQSFLNELYQRTGGDPNQQANMYEVGDSLGLEKGDAGSLAEELMVQGMIELKTLSGGIGITGEGLAAIGASSAGAGANTLQLSKEKVATAEDRSCIEEVSRMVRRQLPDLKLESEHLEEVIIDLKSIDLQLLSPKPKNQIFRQLFASLLSALEKRAAGELKDSLNAVCQ